MRWCFHRSVRKATFLTGLLLLAFSLTTGQAAALGCITNNFTYQYNLDTGEETPIYSDSGPAYYTSPDGRLVARLVFARPPNGIPESNVGSYAVLQMSHKDGLWQTVRLIRAKGDQRTTLRWTADSRRLVYLWKGPDEKLSVGLAGTDGHERITRTLETNPVEQVTFLNERPLDSQFIDLMLNRETGSNTLLFLKLPTLEAAFRIDDLPALRTCVIDEKGSLSATPCLAWNAKTRIAAYLAQADSDEQLHIVSLDKKTRQTLKFQSHLPELMKWSPDGRFLALMTVDPDSDNELYVYSIEQKTLTLAANNVRKFRGAETAAYILLDWSPDSRRLYFPPRNTAGATENQKADLALNKYDVRTAVTTRLGIFYKFPIYGPQNYALVLTEKDGTAFAAVMNLETGQQRRIADTPNPAHSYLKWERDNTRIRADVYSPQVARLIFTDTSGSYLREIDFPGEGFDYTKEWLENAPSYFPYNRDDLPDTSPVRLVYTVRQSEDRTENYYSIWSVNIDQQKAIKLGTENGPLNVFISPNQRFVAFSRSDEFGERATGGSTLYLFSLADGRLLKFPLSGPIQGAGWSPKSDMLIYQLENSDTLSIISRDGKPIKQIENSHLGLNGPKFYWTACKPTVGPDYMVPAE